MTLGDYIKQYPGKVFSIEYYFENYCSECHKYFLEIDQEYSFDCTAADVGHTGYDWIFDIFAPGDPEVDIVDNLIKIVYPSVEDYTCESCKNQMNML